jgi:hypothetical protein
MSVSNSYKILQKRSKLLQKRFINSKVKKNPTGSYAQDMIRTYRLLLHAEIEFYLEQIIITKAKTSLNKWKNKNEPSNILLSLLSFTEINLPCIPKYLNEINSKNDLSFRINNTVNNFVAKIEKRNNGIKEENIMPLMLPLGIDYTKISQTLLNNLSSYGQSRGDAAHNSYKVINIVDPSIEINTSNNIILELKDLDKLIYEL